MATEEQSQPEGQLPDAPNPESGADSAQKGPIKRSWRRKYRKMRAKFEDTMNASNQLIIDEIRAMALARRLQEQNDQILDLLLDMNQTTRLPPHLRFDLREPSEADPAVPALGIHADPDAVQQSLQELRTQLAEGTITAEEYAEKADQLHNSQQIQTTKSLASLEAEVAYSTQAPDPPIDGIDLTEHAPGYMSPSQEEEYLLAMDAALSDPSIYDPDAHDGRPLRMAPSHPLPNEKDLTVRNPDSVYNWLRKNQPQVFLQDKDSAHPENLPEKPIKQEKIGRKRQSAVAGTPGPKGEHDDDEMGFIPETGTGKGKRGKTAVGEDDGAYRPKGGSTRGAKRKREDGDTPAKGRGKKSRASAGAAN